MSNKRTQEIKLNTLLRRNPDQVFSEIDDEVILLSIKNSEYYDLNRIGSEIWHLLRNETTFRNLLTQLMQTYDVSEEMCMNDTRSYLHEAIKKEIIEVVDERLS